MPICLDICLMGERYDAGDGEDPRSPEWPPHPARVFAALRSVAKSYELTPLQQLEQLPPPLIHAIVLAPHSRSRTYVVTNATSEKGGNQNHPGHKSNNLKERVSSFPADPRVQFLWTDDVEISDEALAGLDDLARRVPYLGRSTSPVILAFRRAAEIEPLPGLDILEPTDRGQEEISLRVPFPGFLDELEALHESDQPSWQASRARARQSYRVQRPQGDHIRLSGSGHPPIHRPASTGQSRRPFHSGAAEQGAVPDTEPPPPSSARSRVRRTSPCRLSRASFCRFRARRRSSRGTGSCNTWARPSGTPPDPERHSGRRSRPDSRAASPWVQPPLRVALLAQRSAATQRDRGAVDTPRKTLGIRHSPGAGPISEEWRSHRGSQSLLRTSWAPGPHRHRAKHAATDPWGSPASPRRAASKSSWAALPARPGDFRTTSGGSRAGWGWTLLRCRPVRSRIWRGKR